MKHVKCSIPPEYLKELKEFARKEHVSVSRMINDSITTEPQLYLAVNNWPDHPFEPLSSFELTDFYVKIDDLAAEIIHDYDLHYHGGCARAAVNLVEIRRLESRDIMDVIAEMIAFGEMP